MLLMLIITVLSMSPALRLRFLEKLFAKREVVVPEKLTDERAGKILGDYINHVVMYNFDTRKWNCNYYLGHSVMTTGVDCARMKSEIERTHPNIELAAVVGMAIVKPRLELFTYLPKPATRSNSEPMAYATFITRDKKTGKLNELPQKWVRLSECTHPNFVCEAMPQLLSSMGYSSTPMWHIDWCLDGEKITSPLIAAQEREKYYRQVKKEMSGTKKR